MVKVSQIKTIVGKKRSSNNKRKTVAECESIASGKMQNKVWKPGKVQLKNNATIGQQQNRVWDLGGKD